MKRIVLLTTLITTIPLTASAQSTTEKTADRYTGIGSFASVPTDGTSSRLGMEGNLDFLFAEYQFKSGGGVGVYPHTSIWRFKFHWIGLGFHAYHDLNDTLSAPSIPRSWDLMPVTGFDIRIWKGMEIRTMAAWYFPNPYGVYKEADRQVQSAKERVKNQINTTNPANAQQAQQSSQTEITDTETKIMNLLQESYGNVAKRPHIWIGVRWEF